MAPREAIPFEPLNFSIGSHPWLDIDEYKPCFESSVLYYSITGRDSTFMNWEMPSIGLTNEDYHILAPHGQEL